MYKAIQKPEDFEGIKIMGSNESKSSKPNENEPIYNFYFTLSKSPPSPWVAIFVG